MYFLMKFTHMLYIHMTIWKKNEKIQLLKCDFKKFQTKKVLHGAEHERVFCWY